MASSDGEVRDGFRFRGGSLPLDFAATLELLVTTADLSRWLVAAGLTTAAPRVTPHELRKAQRLREALYRLAVTRAKGKRFSEPDRALLNRWAARATPAPRLEAHGMSWRRADVTTLLATVARSAVELLGGPLGDRIRRCSGDGCALLFVDTSRSGERKWCSMAGCGNKAKVASFRERNR